MQDPLVCTKGHMGPDHPQWEAWQTSQHGTPYGSLGAPDAPGCRICHMPPGSHKVSIGLIAPPGGKPCAQQKVETQRTKVVDLCQICHARPSVASEPENADAVRLQKLKLVDELRSTLDPQPQNRIEHPQRGPELVLDGAMLYKDISHIESRFSRPNKYAAAKILNGAYHQNPDHTHWYGNAEMKLLLNDIKGEASRLRERGGQAKTVIVGP